MLTETDAAGAEVIANRMRAKIGDAHIPTDKGVARLTISIGVAAVNDPNPPDLTNAIKDADEALYRTKSSGRNRVVVASGSA